MTHLFIHLHFLDPEPPVLCISQFQAPTSPGMIVKFPAPGQKMFAKLRPWGKKIEKNPAPGENFVDLQDNFAMIVKPFTFF